MEWTASIKEALRYMEEELLTLKGPEEVAEHVNMSTIYLQRGFQVMTGYTIGEYIRNRRLYLAGLELANADAKIIDIALLYGYETPESFTKAFTRFHDASPSAVRRDRTLIKTFLPLRIHIVIQGGNSMEYTVEKMAGFRVIGLSRDFSFETAQAEIPKFWDEVFTKYVMCFVAGSTPADEVQQAINMNRIGEFGVCIEDGKNDKFRYMIAGRYMGGDVPAGMEVFEVPENEWAKFKCLGPMPEALQTVNAQIWHEWLPGNKEYEVTGTYNIEWYSSGGSTADPDYQSAIWIPVKRK